MGVGDCFVKSLDAMRMKPFRPHYCYMCGNMGSSCYEGVSMTFKPKTWYRKDEYVLAKCTRCKAQVRMMTKDDTETFNMVIHGTDSIKDI